MLKHLKKTIKTTINIFLELKLRIKIFILVVLVILFAGVPIIITGKNAFCNSCHVMNPYYDSWQKSSHASAKCLSCHLQPGLAGYVKGKINGLAQAVDCMVGRIGTKPNAKVEDASCLRAKCHSKKELVSTTIDYGSIPFTHNKHIDKEVGGIEISCSTCHSHFEGNEHFSVNSNACFTCHFTENPEDGHRPVETGCRDCHEVPTKVIKRGLVEIDHTEFVSYNVNCEDSCHKKDIRIVSNVPDNVCLNCHSFSKANSTELDKEELHHVHSTGEKVECFACHGKINHKPGKSSSVSSMINCVNCHSDTHNTQLSTYTAKQHADYEKTDIILSPMFLTHVECVGCHIEYSPIVSDGIGSIGTVAKAVPEACDKCHEQGSGEQYIQFWQQQIKKLYKRVEDKVERYNSITISTEEKSRQRKKIQEVESILKSVKFDGSWGVHNFKYTEAMLLKASAIMDKLKIGN